MARIFLSHSSKDNFEAVAVGDWLAENGWDDAFLDLDPVEGLVPGERWERALYEHAARCEAVLFLVSRNWLASDWCRREYELARKLNKRIFVALIDDLSVPELPVYLRETHQAVALGAGADHRVFRPIMPVTHQEGHVTFSKEGLARLKAGLTKAGLDPRFFAWPPENEPGRAPYRGLAALEEADAGVFFGRDGPIIEALDALRGLSEAAAPRLFVLLGASGAGKSSFLRAGLLPRLERDDRHFLPLPTVRPARAPLTGERGLVAAVAAACARAGLPTVLAEIRAAAAAGAAALRPILAKLAGEATLIVSIDQAEELFRAEGAEEGEALLALLRDMTAQDAPKVIALFSIRSDSYDALEHAGPLEGLRQHAFALLPLPHGAYQTVIEGPAQRLARAGRVFEIEPALTQKLLEDIETGGGADALPLLSFTLEQLYRDHEAAKRITRKDYEAFGGLKGAIDAAMGRVFAAAAADPRIPKDQDARLALLRRGLIPWLAGVDPETKTARRRRAPEAQIPLEARPLIDLLVEQRLLTRDVDEKSHEATLEPAHESLLRQWGSLKNWLAEDFGRLATLEGVKRAALDWDANNREISWAAHSGARLEEADRLDARPDLAAMLNATDRAYLAACREKDKAAKEAAQARLRAEASSAKNAKRVAGVSSIGLVAALALAALAGWQWRAATRAESETRDALLKVTQLETEARAQRDRAEKALATATETANALVFDVAQKLRSVSGVPASLVSDILGRTRKLQQDLAGGGGASAALRRSQAAALTETVDSRLTMGDVKGALDAARQGLEIVQALYDSNPANAEYRRDLSVSHNKLGDVLQAQGDLAGALKEYREGLVVIEALSASNPGNAQWRRDVSFSHNRIGDILRAQGDLGGALAEYRLGLAIVEALAAAEPGVAQWRWDVSISHNKIGDVLQAQSALSAALKEYGEGLAIIEALSASDPRNAEWRRAVSFGHREIGDVLRAQGDLAGALKEYMAALAIVEALSASDPGNARWRWDLSAAHQRVGDVLRAQGDLVGGLKEFRKFLEIVAALSAADPGNAQLRRDVSVSRNKIGQILREQGDLAGALKEYRQGLAIIETLSASAPDNKAWRWDVWFSHRETGDLLRALGDLAGALKEYQQALVVIDALSASDPDNRGWRWHAAATRQRVGDILVAQGDRNGALKEYRQFHELIVALSAADPGNAAWRRDVSVSHNKLGDVLQAQGDQAGALKEYREGLAVIEAVSASDPRNADWRWDLAYSHREIGDVLRLQGDLAGALGEFREGLAILEALAAADPANTKRRWDLAVYNERIAGVLTQQHDAKGAIAAYERVLEIYDELSKAQPDDPQPRLSSVIPHWRLAGLDPNKAREHLEAALAILEPLAKTNRLDAARRGWIEQIQAQLSAIEAPVPTPKTPVSTPAKRKR